MLADAFLEGKEVSDIAQSNVSFRIDVYTDEFWFIDGTYAFDSSLLEVMAQLSWICAKGFIWLLDQCDTVMDTGLLLATVSFHDEFHDIGHKDHCALKKILSGQADPNAAGYLITPLQIAIAIRDIEGVIELLEAGADSNATEDQNGVSFKAKSILEWLNELHGLSPLHICQNIEGPLAHNEYHRLQESRDSKSPVIEALLLQHGAREFLS